MAMATRSAMFLSSDVTRAAEDAAYALGDHGLTPEQVADLSVEIDTAIHAWFRRVRESESA